MNNKIDTFLIDLYNEIVNGDLNIISLRKRIEEKLNEDFKEVPSLSADSLNLFKCLIEHKIRTVRDSSDIQNLMSIKPFLSSIQKMDIETVINIIKKYPDMEQDVLQEYDLNTFRNTLHNLKYITGQWTELDYYDDGVLIRYRFELFTWLNHNIKVMSKYGIISDGHTFFDNTVSIDDETKSRKYVFTKIMGLKGAIMPEDLSYKEIYYSILGEETDEDKKIFSIAKRTKYNRYYDIDINYERKNDDINGFIIDEITIFLIRKKEL